MGICRGTSTRFQYCGSINAPPLGTYPNVCGASTQNFNPNTPKDSSVAMNNLKIRRVIGNSATFLDRELNTDQVSGGVSMILGNVPYDGRRQIKSDCAESRCGGVGRMFNRNKGRAGRCYAQGCYCISIRSG